MISKESIMTRRTKYISKGQLYMSLIPYEPFRQLENVKREFDRFFSSDLPGFITGHGNHFGSLNIDVYDTDTEVIAKCDIPGLEKKEDVTIDIQNNMLTISGVLHRSSDINEEHMHRRERFSGRFQRSISLPHQVSSEGITATYKNGVLDIRMPKMQEDIKKRIDVQFH